MATMKPHHRRRTPGPKNPRPRPHKALPPGFRMRLGRYARPLTREGVDEHVTYGRHPPRQTVVLDLGAHWTDPPQPAPGHPHHGTREYYKTKQVGHLEIPGLVVLYDSNHYMSEVVEAEESLLATLDGILQQKQAGTGYAGATHYKVAKFSPPLWLGQAYLDDIWALPARQGILAYHKNKILQRGQRNRQAGKPAHVL